MSTPGVSQVFGMANTHAHTNFQDNASQTSAVKLQNRITQSPRLALQKKHLNRLFGTGRPLQRLTDEDLETKPDKERKKRLSKKYSDSLGFGKPLYAYAEETFDYYFTQALSLDNLEALIDTAIEKAKKRKEAVELQALKKEDAPVIALPTPSTSLPIPEKAPLKEKVSKKEKPRDITSEVLTGGPSYTQETVYAPKDVTNTLLQTWISGKPLGATCTLAGLYVSDDTVYICATVEMKDLTVTAYPQINQYQIETHYHPVPISSNYLHVKGRSGGSTKNVLGSACWLIPGGTATLNEAVQDWNSAYPTNQSPHKW